MRFPSHLLQTATFRSEPLLAAMAAIAVGMFVGTWIIGPAVTRDSADAPAPAAQQRTTFEDLVARPDPMPYRALRSSIHRVNPVTPLPQSKKAQAEAGGQFVDDASIPEAPRASRWSSRNSNYRSFDRHRVN
jgi:hypothetical protein